MKGVLFIEPWFPPIGGMASLRSLKFVKYLPKYGWKPTVLTVQDGDHYYYDPTLQEEVPTCVNIDRTLALLPTRLARRLRNIFGPTRASDDRSPSVTCLPETKPSDTWAHLKHLVAAHTFIPDYYISWLPFSLIKGWMLMRREEIDIIYTTSGAKTAHLVGLWLKRFSGKPWVADFRDLWINGNVSSRGPLACAIEKAMERAVVRSADIIVVAWPGIGEAFLRGYDFLDPVKFTTITNGFDPDDFIALPSSIQQEKFTITHTGSLYPPGAIKPFFTALTQLPQEVKKSLRLNFIGGMYEVDRDLFVQMGLDRMIVTSPFVPHRHAIHQAVAADVLLLLIWTWKEGNWHLPGKLFDYLGAKKTILALVPPEGEAANVIRETGTGIVIHPEDTAGICEGIISLYQAYKDRSIRLRDVSTTKLKRFERTELAKHLANVFTSLL